MKRNLTLVGILIALLFFTWWFQEIGTQKELAQQEQSLRVFDPEKEGGLLSVQFGSVLLKYKKESESFVVGEKMVPAHPVRVHEVFSALEGLASMRVLSQEERQELNLDLAFPATSSMQFVFTTPKGETTFVVGARLATSVSRFYGKIGASIVILEDRRPLEVAYQSEDEGELKEQRLRTLTSLPEDFFYDSRLLPETFRIHRAIFDNRLARPYEIDIEKKTTNPAVMPGIAYDIDEFETWRSTMETLEAQTVHPSFKETSLKNYRGQLRLKDKEDKTVELSLFGEYGPLKGDFVISSENSYMYELGDNHAGIFFQHVQDFWNLAPYNEQRELTIKMSDGKESYKVTLIPGNIFNVRVEGSTKEPRRDRFAVFYAMLNGRANYVSSSEDAKESDFKILFNLQDGPRAFSFGTALQEWVLIDETNSLAYHYRIQDFPDLPQKLGNFFGKN